MAFIEESSVTCQGCGSAHIIQTHGSINVSETPSIKAKVRDGSLFVWECPSCGRRNLAKYQTLYHDPAQKLMIWLIPDEAKAAALESAMDKIASDDGLSEYTLRRVSDVSSLMEKTAIFDAGLDDCVVEICKWVTKMEMAEKDKSNSSSLLGTTMRFYGLQGADNEILLSFPLGGQIHSVTIGFNVYEDCAGIFQRNPHMRPAPGFAKIDSAWLGQYFR